jgi:hypothetical protein
MAITQDELINIFIYFAPIFILLIYVLRFYDFLPSKLDRNLIPIMSG